jgi:hypothetical protein
MNIIAVIPGAETGVELADRLSHRMVGLKGFTTFSLVLPHLLIRGFVQTVRRALSHADINI